MKARCNSCGSDCESFTSASIICKRCNPSADVVVMSSGTECDTTVLLFAKRLRERGVKVLSDTRPVKLKKKLQDCNKSAAYYSIIIGSYEMLIGCVQIKDMDDGVQISGTTDYAINLMEYMCGTNWFSMQKIQPQRIITIGP
jgi:histidyl-tRNA synthetase